MPEEVNLKNWRHTELKDMPDLTGTNTDHDLRIDGKVSGHSGLTTGIHGVAGTNVAAVGDITTHAGLTTGTHGVGGSTIASVGDISTHSGLTTGVHGVGLGTVAKVGDIATDANLSVAAQAAISASHTRSHSITSSSDHTSGATTTYLLKADANGLPTTATNTDGEVSGAVTHAGLTASTHGVGVSGFEDKGNKGAVSGYAPLDASQLVPVANLGTGATAAKYLRGDQTWQTISAGGGTTPISLEAEAAVLSITNPNVPMEKYSTAGTCTNVPWVELRADKQATTPNESGFWKGSVPSHLAGINVSFDIWFYCPSLNTNNVRFEILVKNRTIGNVVDAALVSVGNTGDVVVPGTALQLGKATINATTPFTSGYKYLLQLRRIAPAGTDLAEHCHILGIDMYATPS